MYKMKCRISCAPSSFQLTQICSNHDCRLKGYTTCYAATTKQLSFGIRRSWGSAHTTFARNLLRKWMEIAHHGSPALQLSSTTLFSCPAWIHGIYPNIIKYISPKFTKFLTIGKHPLTYDVSCYIDFCVVPLELVRDVNHLSKTPHDNVVHACPRMFTPLASR